MTGDPSMSLAIPTAQFRTSYIFVASSTYDSNFVNVTAPDGQRCDARRSGDSEERVHGHRSIGVLRRSSRADEHRHSQDHGVGEPLASSCTDTGKTPATCIPGAWI